MRKSRFLIYIFLSILFSLPFWGAQHRYTESLIVFMGINDSVPPVNDSTLRVPPDSLRLRNDSLPTDSVKKNSSGLDAIVYSTANDSIVFTAENWGYLYGEAEVKYNDITLKGERLSMNMDSSLVYATFAKDSLGKEFGYPIFGNKDSEMEAKSIKYNFRTGKGFTTNLITTQGEGYVVAEKAKKNVDDSFFLLDGRYTTCDDHEHPHFYLALTKGKVKPGKNVVTGPAYLVIEGLPLYPIGLPFGFFPFSEKYSSGIIMPSYGDELERGFNLRGGGYYFAFNDNVDLALTGEIYTKGSWGINARSSYRKRYKYSGSFDGSYLVTKIGEKGIDQTVSKDMRINWTHTQDPKQNQFRTISASVNFSTSTYDRNSLNSMFTPAGTQNTKGSTVNITQRFPNSPWSMSASMSINQRTQDSTISLTLPNLTITMSSVNPFKRKQMVGSEKWYEKIRLSYSGDLRNSIDTKEDRLFKAGFKDWKKGMQHTIPISATFNVFDHLNITPAINYRERWYMNKIRKEWDPEDHVHRVMDTTNGFYRVYDFNTSLSFQTKLYGMYKPLFYKNADIRHVFTPSITLSYAPDFSKPMFGFYDSYYYYDANNQWTEYLYSPYEQGMFGTAPRGAQGTVSFQFDNNVEMKLKMANDSTKKISLIDNLGISFSHNMMADSLKWSDITTNIRLKFSKNFTVNIGAAWDPYLYRPVYDQADPSRIVSLRKVDELRIANGRGFGRLKSTGYSISPSINQDTFKKWFGKKGDKDKTEKDGADPLSEDPEGTGEAAQPRGSLLEAKKDDNEYDEDGYLKNQILWSLGINFSMNYNYDTGNLNNLKVDKDGFTEYKGRLTKNLSLSGNIQPTKNWSFNFNTSYDFDTKKIAHLTCNLTRNLHCWSISASVNPVGPYKTYFVTLRASSSMLQDLKYEQRGRASSYDPDWH